MLKFIDDSDSSVLDLGAGQMYIKNLLPKDIDYYPIDYIQRFPETIVCDLNRKVPNIKADVAFCSGIVEYINDINRFFDGLSKNVSKIIMSYTVYNDTSELKQRRKYGFLNHLNQDELVGLLFSKGFMLNDMGFDVETQQPLFCFIKAN